MRVFIFTFFILFSSTASADCNKVFRFFLGGVAPIIQGSYWIFKGDGCSGESRYSLQDLFNPNVFLKDDYYQIVENTFEKIEEDDSWNPDALVLRTLKKIAPQTYQGMKDYLINNTGSLLGLNSKEKALIKENPAAALWVMYNGKRSENMQEEYRRKLTEQNSEIRREESSYLGKVDAFRHLAWNILSSKYGFEKFAKKFIEAHEHVDEVDQNVQNNPWDFQAGITNQILSNEERSLFQTLFSEEMMRNQFHDQFNTKLDLEMDVFNNNLGLELSKELYCTMSQDTIFNKIVDAIDNGKAVIVENCIGEKSKIIKSNKDFRKCLIDSDPLNYQKDCEKLSREIKSSITKEELIELVKTKAPANVVSCAYFKALKKDIDAKYPEDKVLLKANKEIKDKSFLDANLDGSQSIVLGTFFAEKEEVDHLCNILNETFDNRFKSKMHCTEA